MSTARPSYPATGPGESRSWVLAAVCSSVLRALRNDRWDRVQHLSGRKPLREAWVFKYLQPKGKNRVEELKRLLVTLEPRM